MQTVVALVRPRRPRKALRHTTGRSHRHSTRPAPHPQRRGVDGGRDPPQAESDRRRRPRVERRGERPCTRTHQDPYGRLPALHRQLQAVDTQPCRMRHTLHNVQLHARARLDTHRPRVRGGGRLARAALRACGVHGLRPIHTPPPRRRKGVLRRGEDARPRAT